MRSPLSGTSAGMHRGACTGGKRADACTWTSTCDYAGIDTLIGYETRTRSDTYIQMHMQT
jgi:hypothetical protein